MSLINLLLKIAGKEKMVLDERISNKYLFGLCTKYGTMMIRGKLISFNSREIANNIFVGKHVKIREKQKLKIGNKSKLHDNVYIDALSENGVNIGNNVIVGRASRIECTGSLNKIGKGIIIGNNTSFGSDCFFGAAGGIEIGENVICGQYIRFHAENHIYSDITRLIKEQGVTHKGIKIGNNCWIGAGAVFLDGAKIGDGCVVAANAVVSGEFGSNVVIGGIPAKVIKKRD